MEGDRRSVDGGGVDQLNSVRPGQVLGRSKGAAVGTPGICIPCAERAAWLRVIDPSIDNAALHTGTAPSPALPPQPLTVRTDGDTDKRFSEAFGPRNSCHSFCCLLGLNNCRSICLDLDTVVISVFIWTWTLS